MLTSHECCRRTFVRVHRCAPFQVVAFPPFMLWWFVFVFKDYDPLEENGAWISVVPMRPSGASRTTIL